MELKVKEFVSDLFSRGYGREKVEKKVLKFFKNYDQAKEPHIAKL